MTIRESALAAVALSAAAWAAGPVPALAAGVPPYGAYGGVGQHRTVMNDIARAQRRDAAAISHVQNNIRSTRPKVY